jgi:PPOX class probable F420-dependent enzyme
MDDRARAFLEQNQTAAMITLRTDGTAHATRVGVGLVDDKIWSSGTRSRVRTRNLRRDPRSTLMIFDTRPESNWRWLTLECTVTIIEGPDIADQTLRIYPDIQASAPAGHVIWMGQQKPEAEYRQIIADEGRLIYEFTPLRTYGMY